jgi:pyruvate ferredoxin oxidoreductase beta subunit
VFKKDNVSYLREDIFIKSGNTLCPGCSFGTLIRLVFNVIGGNAIATVAAGCSVSPFVIYPTAVKVPTIMITMPSGASSLTGIRMGLNALERRDKIKREKTQVIAFVGDGATSDIGLASLSGAAERNDDGIYICFDNEAYMMTGVQRSSTTPCLAWTSTTPKGKARPKKNLPLLMADHNIPYVATASIGFPRDLMIKIKKAKDLPGFKYVHVLSPCPTGWGFPPDKTMRYAQLAVETGLWILYEVENGGKSITYRPGKRRPVEDYLNLQGRFGHLTNEEIQSLQKSIDEKWSAIDL